MYFKLLVHESVFHYVHFVHTFYNNDTDKESNVWGCMVMTTLLVQLHVI